ncbi:MAG TPA: hypothetical protein VJ932_02455, partial [Alkalispirochaeta sp.]|nr:hypothetical protein [Alkalispirochaeta sp.]
ELHHTSGAVASLLPTPPDDRGGASRAPNPGPAGARSEAPRVGRLTQRPPRGERVAHIRRVVGQWREQAVEGRWDTAQRDVLFHLAPVEVLQALRGERDQKAVIAAAHTGLDVIQQVVERISPA